MKTKFILLLLLTSANAFADNRLEADCRRNGLLFGDGSSRVDQIEKSCVDACTSSTSGSVIKQVLTNGHTATTCGLWNLLVTTEWLAGHQVQHILSGAQSGLGTIIDVVPDFVHRELIVLANASGRTPVESIFVYSMDASGNIAPIRKIVSPELEGTTAITLADGLIVVANGTHGRLSFFSTQANSDSHKPENKPTVLGIIGGQLTQLGFPAGITTQGSEIFVTDRDPHQPTLVFKASQRGNSPPVRTITP